MIRKPGIVQKPNYILENSKRQQFGEKIYNKYTPAPVMQEKEPNQIFSDSDLIFRRDSLSELLELLKFLREGTVQRENQINDSPKLQIHQAILYQIQNRIQLIQWNPSFSMELKNALNLPRTGTNDLAVWLQQTEEAVRKELKKNIAQPKINNKNWLDFIFREQVVSQKEALRNERRIKKQFFSKRISKDNVKDQLNIRQGLRSVNFKEPGAFMAAEDKENGFRIILQNQKQGIQRQTAFQISGRAISVILNSAVGEKQIWQKVFWNRQPKIFEKEVVISHTLSFKLNSILWPVDSLRRIKLQTYSSIYIRGGVEKAWGKMVCLQGMIHKVLRTISQNKQEFSILNRMKMDLSKVSDITVKSRENLASFSVLKASPALIFNRVILCEITRYRVKQRESITKNFSNSENSFLKLLKRRKYEKEIERNRKQTQKLLKKYSLTEPYYSIISIDLMDIERKLNISLSHQSMFRENGLNKILSVVFSDWQKWFVKLEKFSSLNRWRNWIKKNSFTWNLVNQLEEVKNRTSNYVLNQKKEKLVLSNRSVETIWKKEFLPQKKQGFSTVLGRTSISEMPVLCKITEHEWNKQHNFYLWQRKDAILLHNILKDKIASYLYINKLIENKKNETLNQKRTEENQKAKEIYQHNQKEIKKKERFFEKLKGRKSKYQNRFEEIKKTGTVYQNRFEEIKKTETVYQNRLKEIKKTGTVYQNRLGEIKETKSFYHNQLEKSFYQSRFINSNKGKNIYKEFKNTEKFFLYKNGLRNFFPIQALHISYFQNRNIAYDTELSLELRKFAKFQNPLYHQQIRNYFIEKTKQNKYILKSVYQLLGEYTAISHLKYFLKRITYAKFDQNRLSKRNRREKVYYNTFDQRAEKGRVYLKQLLKLQEKNIGTYNSLLKQHSRKINWKLIPIKQQAVNFHKVFVLSGVLYKNYFKENFEEIFQKEQKFQQNKQEFSHVDLEERKLLKTSGIKVINRKNIFFSKDKQPDFILLSNQTLLYEITKYGLKQDKKTEVIENKNHYPIPEFWKRNNILQTVFGVLFRDMKAIEWPPLRVISKKSKRKSINYYRDRIEIKRNYNSLETSALRNKINRNFELKKETEILSYKNDLLKWTASFVNQKINSSLIVQILQKKVSLIKLPVRNTFITNSRLVTRLQQAFLQLQADLKILIDRTNKSQQETIDFNRDWMVWILNKRIPKFLNIFQGNLSISKSMQERQQGCKGVFGQHSFEDRKNYILKKIQLRNELETKGTESAAKLGYFILSHDTPKKKQGEQEPENKLKFPQNKRALSYTNRRRIELPKISSDNYIMQQQRKKTDFSFKEFYTWEQSSLKQYFKQFYTWKQSNLKQYFKQFYTWKQSSPKRYLNVIDITKSVQQNKRIDTSIKSIRNFINRGEKQNFFVDRIFNTELEENKTEFILNWLNQRPLFQKPDRGKYKQNLQYVSYRTKNQEKEFSLWNTILFLPKIRSREDRKDKKTRKNETARNNISLFYQNLHPKQTQNIFKKQPILQSVQKTEVKIQSKKNIEIRAATQTREHLKQNRKEHFITLHLDSIHRDIRTGHNRKNSITTETIGMNVLTTVLDKQRAVYSVSLDVISKSFSKKENPLRLYRQLGIWHKNIPGNLKSNLIKQRSIETMFFQKKTFGKIIYEFLPLLAQSKYVQTKLRLRHLIKSGVQGSNLSQNIYETMGKIEFIFYKKAIQEQAFKGEQVNSESPLEYKLRLKLEQYVNEQIEGIQKSIIQKPGVQTQKSKDLQYSFAEESADSPKTASTTFQEQKNSEAEEQELLEEDQLYRRIYQRLERNLRLELRKTGRQAN